MGGGYWSYESIPDLVKSGKLPEATLDKAVSRVLRSKFTMGLFEKPFTGVADDKIWDYINTKQHKKIARDLDAESIVLLENHDNVLPLKKNANVAVIGPMAHGYVNVSNSPLLQLSNNTDTTPVRRLCHPHCSIPWHHTS